MGSPASGGCLGEAPERWADVWVPPLASRSPPPALPRTALAGASVWRDVSTSQTVSLRILLGWRDPWEQSRPAVWGGPGLARLALGG